MGRKKLFVVMLLIALNFFTLAAMLGQVDMQLNPWYSKPNSLWWFPWGIYKAVIAWELEYTIILLTAFSSLVLGYLLCRYSNKEI